jgi:hypothetical protein
MNILNYKLDTTYAQENKDMYFSLGAVQTKFGSTDVSSRTKDGIARNAVTAASKASPLAADIETVPAASLE